MTSVNNVITVAPNRPWEDQTSGERQKETESHRITCVDRMITHALLILTCLFGTTLPAVAQVLKCVDGEGKVQFSNIGCPAGTSQRHVEVRPNSVDMSGLREQAASLAVQNARTRSEQLQSYSAQQGRAPAGSSCPSELAIRNMEVSVSSPSLGKKERTFHEAEIRRARQCRAGEGVYADADWKASKEALADQRTFKEEDRRQARARAEGIHSAANPREGDRIAQERQAEASREAERREAAAEAAAAARAQAAQNNRFITSCKSTGCTASDGQFYWNKGGGTFAGPNGFCRRIGNQLSCN